MAALRALGEGRPAVGILNGLARDQRDAALRAMRAAHFGDVAPSRAAKRITSALARYEAAGWSADRSTGRTPRAGTLRRGLFDVLSLGPAPGWRTTLDAL
ncbi:MAG: hypothetical protein IPK81_14090 [Rhodospirillales bacterium]|nr:MAG: hypothetical protein IPK81_14090 [Rhodospirillales bacterium]